MNNPQKILGHIFNIQKFSVHDGPGIRDIVFMKGCPLKCQWCSNPESQNSYAEIGFIENRCIGAEVCGYCIKSCLRKAISYDEKVGIHIDREKCNNCGECVTVCPAKAITLFGKMMSVEEVLKALQEENVSWRTSGGVTISGGELLLQAEFVQLLLYECQKRGIHTAIETSGFGRWEDLKGVCQYTDLIFYDIKTLDTKKHKEYIGVENELILENIYKIAKEFPNTSVIVRTPVVPGFNDNEEDITAIAGFIKDMPNLKDYELLAYHAFGQPKYKQLGRKYILEDVKLKDKEYVSKLNQKVRALLNIN